jgi:hypothetical protein
VIAVTMWVTAVTMWVTAVTMWLIAVTVQGTNNTKFIFCKGKGKGKAISLQVSYRTTGFQKGESPRFLDNRHTKVLSVSALRTGRLYS